MKGVIEMRVIFGMVIAVLGALAIWIFVNSPENAGWRFDTHKIGAVTSVTAVNNELGCGITALDDPKGLVNLQISILYRDELSQVNWLTMGMNRGEDSYSYPEYFRREWAPPATDQSAARVLIEERCRKAIEKLHLPIAASVAAHNAALQVFNQLH